MKTSSFLLHPLFAAGLLLGVAFDAASARTWKETGSDRTIEGEFAGVAGDKVKVKRADGRTVEVSLAILSEDDRAYVAAQGGGAAEWPTWRGPARDDHSPDTGLLKEWPEDGPELLWSFKDGGKGYSSPVISGGKLYFTGSRKGSAKILCLELESGKELWEAELGPDPEKGYNVGWGGGPRGAPTVSDGMVYAISANGMLVAVDAEKGGKKWSKDFVADFGGEIPAWGYSESPLVDGEKLLVTPGGKNGAIVAFDKKSGKEIWRSKGLEDSAQYSSIIPADVNGKRQYVQLFMNTLAGVDAESGKVLWKSDWKDGRTAVIPTPIYSDGRVYMTSGYGAGSKLVDIRGAEAKDVWVNKVMKNHHGGVVLVDGHLYGFSDGGGLVCQNLASGEKVWNESGEGIQKGAVHYADGMLYCVDEHEGSVFLAEASPKGYKEHGRFPMPAETKLREGTNGKVWTHPVVIGGRLYLRDQDLLFCFDVKG